MRSTFRLIILTLLQLNIDSLIKKSHIGQLPSEQLVRPKDQRLNSQPDSGIEQSLDFASLASGQQDANGTNTSLIGMNRPNVNSAPTTNNSDGYKSMDESSENSQGNLKTNNNWQSKKQLKAKYNCQQSIKLSVT